MFNRIKAAFIGAVIVAAGICCSGCAVIAADISEFEVPPKLTAEQQAISDALERGVGKNITLKYPLSGDYRSAFILRSLEKNKPQKAIAFYSPSNGNDGPHIAILDKVNGAWSISADLTSQGNEIDSIDFGDFNGDGNDEIAVGWRSFNSTDLTLLVYAKDGNSYSKTKLGTFTKMKTVDMDNDGKKDILLFQLNSDPNKAKARLISFRNGELREIGSCPLDSTVTGYADVYVSEMKNSLTSVLIDGYKSNDKMITEVVYYNKGKLVSPLYDKISKTVKSTMRFVTYKCTDINNDKKIEIPMPVELPTKGADAGEKQKWLVRWSNYNFDGTLTTAFSAVMNYNSGYYFKYPDKWGKNVTISSDSTDNVWTFCKWDETNSKYGDTLFTLYVFKHDTWNELTNKEYYSVISEGNGMVYAARINQKSEKDTLNLSIEEIRSNFGQLN